MKLTNSFQEVVGATSGTYQLKGLGTQVEICVSDSVPTEGTGISIFNNLSEGWTVRNFDTVGSKLWARTVSGECEITVVLGFL
ncbi:MAG: hypothetical protein ACRCZ9_10185 [Fusobacteriaceae bacterium]